MDYPSDIVTEPIAAVCVWLMPGDPTIPLYWAVAVVLVVYVAVWVWAGEQLADTL